MKYKNYQMIKLKNLLMIMNKLFMIMNSKKIYFIFNFEKYNI